MSAKYIKTDSWTYVNPSPSLACLFLRALYTFKTIRPIFQIILPHSYNLETKGDLSLSFSLSLSSLSSCEFFGNCAKNFPTRLYRYELYLPSFLTLFSRIEIFATVFHAVIRGEKIRIKRYEKSCNEDYSLLNVNFINVASTFYHKWDAISSIRRWFL